MSEDYQPLQLIKTVESLPLAFEPGTNVKQSATNFLLLASIIEKVGKMPYHDFVKSIRLTILGCNKLILVRIWQK